MTTWKHQHITNKMVTSTETMYAKAPKTPGPNIVNILVRYAYKLQRLSYMQRSHHWQHSRTEIHICPSASLHFNKPYIY